VLEAGSKSRDRARGYLRQEAKAGTARACVLEAGSKSRDSARAGIRGRKQKQGQRAHVLEAGGKSRDSTRFCSRAVHCRAGCEQGSLLRAEHAKKGGPMSEHMGARACVPRATSFVSSGGLRGRGAARTGEPGAAFEEGAEAWGGYRHSMRRANKWGTGSSSPIAYSPFANATTWAVQPGGALGHPPPSLTRP